MLVWEEMQVGVEGEPIFALARVDPDKPVHRYPPKFGYRLAQVEDMFEYMGADHGINRLIDEG